MKSTAPLLFTSLALRIPAWAREMPDPGLEEPHHRLLHVPHPAPGSAGFGGAVAMRRWACGVQAGNPNVGRETTLFDDGKIRTDRSAD